MKTMALSALIGLSSMAVQAAPAKLLDAICQVESGNRSNVISDGGKAVGAYQIHPIMVKEVNRISGKKYTLKDRQNKEKSRQMCNIYLDWVYSFNKKKGNILSDSELARCWNGGNWNSWQWKSTRGYKAKIEKHL